MEEILIVSLGAYSIAATICLVAVIAAKHKRNLYIRQKMLEQSKTQGGSHGNKQESDI